MFANTYLAIVTNSLLPIFAISYYQVIWKHFSLYTNTTLSNAWRLAKALLSSARGSKWLSGLCKSTALRLCFKGFAYVHNGQKNLAFYYQFV